jgi:hypothetical protein
MAHFMPNRDTESCLYTKASTKVILCTLKACCSKKDISSSIMSLEKCAPFDINEARAED